jgi:amino acid transporter
MYGALGVTLALYPLISVGVFGTVDEVVGYGETAIAEAARPAPGDAGFVMVAIAAMLATASPLNTTLYASAGLTKMPATGGQFPTFFGRETRRGAPAGLIITSGLVLVVANVVDLSAIASVGSAIALVVFLVVAMAGYRRRVDTGASPVIALAAVGVRHSSSSSSPSTWRATTRRPSWRSWRSPCSRPRLPWEARTSDHEPGCGEALPAADSP